MREKYQEIKRRVKEEKKITKAYEELQKIKRKEAKRKLVKTVRNILEESSSEDQNKRKKKSTDSCSDSPKKSKRKCKIKVIRVTGSSNVEGRRTLAEKEEVEVNDELARNDIVSSSASMNIRNLNTRRLEVSISLIPFCFYKCSNCRCG